MSREAFERRLDAALDTQSHDELLALTRDLDLKTDNQYAARKNAELGVRINDTCSAHVNDVEHMVNIFGGSNRSGAWDVPLACMRHHTTTVAERVIRVVSAGHSVVLECSHGAKHSPQ